ACERDPQRGSGSCCAASPGLRGLHPPGKEGDECHRSRHQVPFLGKQQHHSCPCLPHLLCSRFLDSRFCCSVGFKNIDF
ncbi:PROK1 protein, partial [Cnemophilus loriae]|nr:PROK1 protein [Cnemophilus loriae]